MPFTSTAFSAPINVPPTFKSDDHYVVNTALFFAPDNDQPYFVQIRAYLHHGRLEHHTATPVGRGELVQVGWRKAASMEALLLLVQQ
jgi:hypothetical protein